MGRIISGSFPSSSSYSSSQSVSPNHQQSNRVRKHGRYPNLSPGPVIPLNPRFLEEHYNYQIRYDKRSRTFRKVSRENEDPHAIAQHYNNQIWYDQKRGVFRRVSGENLHRPCNSYSSRSASYESRTYESTYYPSRRTVSSATTSSNTSWPSSTSAFSNPYPSYSRRGISRHPDNPANKSNSRWLLENGHARLFNFIQHLGMSGYYDSHWRRAKAIRTRMRTEEQEVWEAEQLSIRVRRRNVDGDIDMIL